MSRSFEELARAATPMGDVVLRRRLEPTLQIDIFEVMLGGDGLMSSLFTDSEVALARLGLGATSHDPIDVVVGGLGLGYTARTVLRDARVRSLHVIDTLDIVIDWHRQHLTPLGAELTGDPRCHLVHGDFFALAEHGRPLGGEAAKVHAILVDIDHSPTHLLHPSHASLYESAGLRRVVGQLHPGGVFALWSNDPPDDQFVSTLRHEFASAEAHIVSFPNFLIDGDSHTTIYVATTPTTGRAATNA
jgi:spermidine synthase